MVINALKTIVGERFVLADADSCTQYGTDRSTLWHAAPRCVVLPGSTEEVRRIVQFAREQRIALVPSGGRTGLSGGAVACNGEVVVSLRRMDKVIGFDPVEHCVTVQAGMITQRVQEFAAARGLFYAVDFASAGSSQIGGNVATNAGGIKVIRYGMTREQVRGLRVVDGNGEVLELNRGLVKNNSGPDFRHLFIGSEGILGIVCEVTLALRRAPADSSVLLLAVAELGSILEVLGCFRAELELSAFEFFDQHALHKVLQHTSGTEPLAARAPFYALLEIDRTETDRALGLFEHCLARQWVLDGVLSQSIAQARALWGLRENISEALAHRVPYKNDISVGVSRLPAFVTRVEALVAEHYAGMEVVWYGHIGDGNLHLNILRPGQMDAREFGRHCATASHAIAALVQEFGGSISAEHGVGLLKKDYLRYTRSTADLRLLAGLKTVFDPLGIMNPGKVIDSPNIV